MQVADVRNAAGYITGILCDVATRKCFAYIIPPGPCEPGSKTPMLISSPVGAFGVVAACTPLNDSKLMRLLEFESALAAYKSGGEISFAIPMDGGHFEAVKFSTAGATAAIERAGTFPEKQKVSPEKSRKSSSSKSM